MPHPVLGQDRARAHLRPAVQSSREPSTKVLADRLPVKILTILNDAPYGSERSYNGLRLAMSLSRTDGAEQRIFLMADAVFCARAGQKTPDGYYNVERMLGSVARKGAEVGTCGTCMDSRGMGDADLTDGVRRSTMAELAEWALWADKILTW